MTQQPSGWYDDPQNPDALRYWDGVLWTEHVTAKRTPPPPAAPPGGALDLGAPPTRDYGTGSAGAPPGPGPGVFRAHPPQQGYSPQPPPGYAGAPNPAGSSRYGLPPAPAYPLVLGPTTPDGVPLAGPMQRLGARIIDGVITSVLTAIVGATWIIDYVAWFGGIFEDMVRDAERGVTTVDQVAVQEEMIGFLVPIILISLVVSVLYETLFLVKRGATPGKMLLGISVRRTQTPGPPRLVDALKRQAIPVGCNIGGLLPLVSFITMVVYLLDPAWMLWDKRRQALHDKVADTSVVLSPRPVR